jgi:ribonuclease HI
MSYLCTICDRKLTSESGLIMHTEAKHGRSGTHKAMRAWEKSRHQLGALTLNTRSSKHEICYNAEDEYDYYREEWVCYICDKGYERQRHLEQHLNSGVHEDKRYHCEGCSREFTSLSGLQQHNNKSSCSAFARRLVTVAVADARDQMLMLTNQGSSSRPEATLRFDGSTDGSNPSQSGGAGWVLECCYSGEKIEEGNEHLSGDDFSWAKYQVTSNQAEYMGLFRGLTAAKNHGIRRLKVEGDSELVIRHMKGQYQCRKSSIKPLYDRCVRLAHKFQDITYEHIYRDKNKRADYLARQAARQTATYNHDY